MNQPQYSEIATGAQAPVAVFASPLVSRVGFIDLGSNSCRLTVVEFDRRGELVVLDRVKNMVRLGEGAFADHTLIPTAKNRTLDCLKAFKKICNAYGVKEIIAVGTAALRSATNAQTFVDEVREQCGISIDVIAGEEEARLIRTGIWATFPKTHANYLFIDIGGGSTELSVSSACDIRFLESLNVGCVLVTDAVPVGKTGRVSDSIFTKMRELARYKLQHVIDILKTKEYCAAVASSGTAQALLAFAQSRLPEGEMFVSRPEGTVLPLKDLEAAAGALSAMTLAQRQANGSMSATRAQVIVGGAAILLEIMHSLGLKEVVVTTANLQDGQVVDYVRRHWPKNGQQEKDWRRKSVKRLAKRTHCDKAHAKTVARLSESLFRGALSLNLARYQAGLEELLSYAARLHDIGIAVSYADHYRHGAYLLRHAPLLGFTQTEILTMARLVYMHSKVSAEWPDFLAGVDATHTERIAGLCLYLAESLDRTHAGLVRGAYWVREAEALRLVVDAAAPVPLEKSLSEKMAKAIRRVTGGSVEIEFVEPEAI